MTTEMESREMTTAPYELVSELGGVLARINVRGSAVLALPAINRGTAFTLDERQALGLDGLLPSGVTTLEGQVRRVYAQYLEQANRTLADRLQGKLLLIHGEADRNTLPAHSTRILEALRGSKRLLLVPRAGHNDVLNGDVWRQIESWITSVLVESSKVES